LIRLWNPFIRFSPARILSTLGIDALSITLHVKQPQWAVCHPAELEEPDGGGASEKDKLSLLQNRKKLAFWIWPNMEIVSFWIVSSLI
jgi:hypothetical protein